MLFLHVIAAKWGNINFDPLHNRHDMWQMYGNVIGQDIKGCEGVGYKHTNP